MHDRLMNKNKGYTLIEMVTVVAIAAFLATLVIPRLTGYMERVRAAEGAQFLTALLRSQMAFELETGNFDVGNCANLDVEILTSANFDLPPTCGAGPIATITRSIEPYTLRIDALGNITCMSFIAGRCAEAGY